MADERDSRDLLVGVKLSSPTLKNVLRKYQRGWAKLSPRCRQICCRFHVQISSIVWGLRRIEAAFCKLWIWLFSYNGRCSTNVEFWGFILFRSMFGGSVVEWSELLIKVFISCRFQAKSSSIWAASLCAFANFISFEEGIHGICLLLGE